MDRKRLLRALPALLAGGAAGLALSAILLTPGWPAGLAGAAAALASLLALGLAYRRGRDERDALRQRQAELETLVARQRAELAERERTLRFFEDATRCAKLGYFAWDMRNDRAAVCSPVYAEIYGTTVEEYLARQPTLLNDADMVHPDDRAMYIQACTDQALAAEPLILNYRIRTADGTVKHLRMEEYRIAYEDGEAVYSEGIVQDMTGLRQMETLLLRAMNASRLLFVIFDPEDRLLLANPAFRTLYGSEGVSVRTGMRHETLIREAAASGLIEGSPAEREAWARRRLERRRKPATALQFETTSGRWLEVSDLVMDDGHLFTLAIDVTEQKRVQAILAEADRREAASRLAAGMAHDFNNLLGVIRGNAELLGDRDKGGEELVAAIIRASDRAADMTQHLLAFTRQQPLHPRIVNLGATAAELLPQFERSLGAGVAVTFEAPEEPIFAEVDQTQLENALLNLVLNAGAAMPQGGRLGLRCGRGRPQQAASGTAGQRDYALLAVADSGHGMTPEVAARAFEPFFTTAPLTESPGLGLSMVHGFATQSGGLVELESAPGAGTEVRLYLPLTDKAPTDKAPTDKAPTDSALVDSALVDGTLTDAAPAGAALAETALAETALAETALPAPPREPAIVPPADEDAVGGREETILVLDDNTAVRTMIRGQLRRLGYRVEAAADAEQAHRILDQGTIDLALVDVALADGARGPDVVADARARHPDLKVLYLTGHAEDAEHPAPADGLLRKPFTRRQLSEALSRALGQGPG